MNTAYALTLLLALSGLARAEEPPALSSQPASAPEAAAPRPAAGWMRQANSLLLRAEDGSLSQEIPLREPDETGAVSHETLGGASPDARVAWTLDRRLTWNPGRTRLLESRRLLRTYGTSGQELWHDDAADSPERGEPVLFSADGKTVLYSRRSDSGWSVEARTWLGQTLVVMGPYPRLIAMALAPGGRYAFARWGVPDKSDTHTFVDLATKARRDVPSSDLVLGLARIGDDGVARTGSRTVFSFVAAASTAAVAAPKAP